MRRLQRAPVFGIRDVDVVRAHLLRAAPSRLAPDARVPSQLHARDALVVFREVQRRPVGVDDVPFAVQMRLAGELHVVFVARHPRFRRRDVNRAGALRVGGDVDFRVLQDPQHGAVLVVGGAHAGAGHASLRERDRLRNGRHLRLVVVARRCGADGDAVARPELHAAREDAGANLLSGRLRDVGVLRFDGDAAAAFVGKRGFHAVRELLAAVRIRDLAAKLDRVVDLARILVLEGAAAALEHFFFAELRRRGRLDRRLAAAPERHGDDRGEDHHERSYCEPENLLPAQALIIGR
jgi:hypothetical protein